MSPHNIGFYEDLTKIIFELSSNMHLISSAAWATCKFSIKSMVMLVSPVLHFDRKKKCYMTIFHNTGYLHNSQEDKAPYLHNSLLC